MKQKTLTKMNKFCKMTGMRLGQLIANLTYQHDNQFDPFYISDGDLERLFNAYYLENKPIKNRGGYYPLKEIPEGVKKFMDNIFPPHP